MADLISTLKFRIKPHLPEVIQTQLRKRRFASDQARYRNRPLGEVFEEIYEQNTWDNGVSDGIFRSGPGSLPEATALYEAFVVDHIMRHPTARTLVDIGCGDFQVSDRILAALAARGRDIRYIGCDIASNVVTYNQANRSRPGVTFERLDVSTELPPEGDIVTIREVFQHLGNAVILAAIANLRARFATAIVTESVHPNPSRPNIDLVSGFRTRDGADSGVYIDLPPFSLPILEEQRFDLSPTAQFRTSVVALR